MLMPYALNINLALHSYENNKQKKELQRYIPYGRAIEDKILSYSCSLVIITGFSIWEGGERTQQLHLRVGANTQNRFFFFFFFVPYIKTDEQ